MWRWFGMTQAQRIMKRKAFIKAEMDRRAPQSDALWQEAAERLESILARYASLSGGVRAHTDNFIFPAAAIYLTAKEALGQPAAYGIIEDSAARHSASAGQKLARLVRLPGMAGLFVRIWDPLAKRLFGESHGFQNRFYPKRKGEYRMDVLACPYFRYFTELGCPELTGIFCDNDERTYGSLPGLAFERTGTLGKGADRCDFCIRRVRVR